MYCLDFEKKLKKIFSFSIFLAKIILFLYEIEFYMKNAFFWCIICWCRSKIAKFWNFAHFLAIFSTFSIFAFFLWFVEKKFWKRLKSVGNDPKLCGNMIFDLFVAPEQRKMGGPPAPGKASRTSPLLGLKLWGTWRTKFQ